MLENTAVGRMLRFVFAIGGLALCLAAPLAWMSSIAVRVLEPGRSRGGAVRVLDLLVGVQQATLAALGLGAGVAVVVVVLPERVVRRLPGFRDDSPPPRAPTPD